MNKRFNVTANEENWLEITDNGVNLSQLQVCDLLNIFYEENEQLKKSVKRQQISNEECSKYIEEIVIENEQLKQQNEHLEKQIKCITQSLQNELNNYGFR